jgi:inner membrane protein
MGIALFGLSKLDPTVAAHPETARAVLLGTVIGSEIPDADTVTRFFGSAVYIRHHRGLSHSLPMLFIWPTLVTSGLSLFLPGADWLHVWLWTFVAVFIHVFIDLFNAYGTQALRPLTPRWISLDVLHIFDPFIFSLHLLGFLLWWLLPDRSGPVFTAVYLLIAAYIALRSLIHHRIVCRLQQDLPSHFRVTVTPTARFHVWNVIVEEPRVVKVGEFRKGNLIWTGQIRTADLVHPAAIRSRDTDAVEAFLSFSSYGYPKVYTRPFGFEVRWLDVRYVFKKRFPFVAVALLDQELRPFGSFVGWMNREQLEKKVRHLLS